MKVTIKELAELLGAKKTAAKSGLNGFAIGQEVIIRTYSAGVWFGRLKEKAGDEIILTEARRMWRWWAKVALAKAHCSTSSAVSTMPRQGMWKSAGRTS
mgnify:CR=1 FL=1